MLIGFIGGIIFLASILMVFCAIVSRKWINADIEATNWNESSELAGQLENEAVDALHHQADCYPECQQPVGSQMSNDYSASSRR